VKVGATYEASDEGIVSTSSFVSQVDETPEVRAETYRESLGWYDAITEDMFG
jgi:sulfide dehydrogenase [flavocytochrome c] flavoprotein subunit